MAYLRTETIGHDGILSNVLGGAFMPDISNDGTVVFSLYEKGKYQIAILDKINFYDNKIGYSNLNENRSDFNSFEEKVVII